MRRRDPRRTVRPKGRHKRRRKEVDQRALRGAPAGGQFGPVDCLLSGARSGARAPAPAAGVPYHPSIRHIAFRVELDRIEGARTWLEKRGIEVRESFGFSPDQQPLVLDDNSHALAAIYFADPDGNSLEFIAPLRLDVDEAFPMMELRDWYRKGHGVRQLTS